MYVVITGQSEFVVQLAKLFEAKGKNKTVLVVRDKEIATQLSHELHAIIVNADSTDTKALDELNLRECDAFISATDSTKANVLSAIYAKNAGAKKILVRVENPSSEAILEKLGFISINADHFAANMVELMITRPAVSDLVSINIGEFDMIEVLGKETNLVGKELGNAKGNNFTAIATYANAKYDFSKEKKIEPNDTVILLVNSGKEKQVEKELK